MKETFIEAASINEAAKGASTTEAEYQGYGDKCQPPVKIKKIKGNNNNTFLPTSLKDCILRKYFDGFRFGRQKCNIR